MSAIIKENIIQSLVTDIDAITAVQYVSSGGTESVDLNNLPAVLIYETGDTVEERETNYLLTRVLTISVEFWTGIVNSLSLADSVSYIEAEIMMAVMSNNDRSGFARYTESQSMRRILPQNDTTLVGGVMEFIVAYQVNELNPSSSY